ncbi:MAG: hypothetical protein M3M89_02325 [Thermoproteota archaeon]|nr:hypothetical protein [Thermoproteota archaeon]
MSEQDIQLVVCNTTSRRLRPEAEQARSRIIAIAQSHAGIRHSELVHMTNLSRMALLAITSKDSPEAGKN